MEAISTIFKLKDGNTAIASRVIDTDIFSILCAEITDARKLRYEQGKNVWREILIANDGKLVGVTSYGTWDDLGTVCALVLDGLKIDAEREQRFLKSGMFSLTSAPSAVENDEEIICECMTVTRGTIKAAIQAGATEVEQVSEKTGASTVCGSCRPKIAGMLGREIWMPATMGQTKIHNKWVRSFLLKPIKVKFASFAPGQYVIVQVQINRNWVERAYTLTSLPSQESYEITVKLEPHGLFSQWLFQQIHDIPLVRVSPPQGQFLFDPQAQFPAVCFAGGIGITPIFTYVGIMAETKSQRRLHIEYCATKAEDFIFVDELKKIIQQYPNISLNFYESEKQGNLTAKKIAEVLANFPSLKFILVGQKALKKL